VKKPLLLLHICSSLLDLLANFSIKKVAFSAFVLLFSSISYADAICRDGWWSKSEGSGTCSWHGGVKRWLADGTITLWQFLIILGIALVIFIIIRKKSSKSNSHISTKKTYRKKVKSASTSNSLPKNPNSPLSSEENTKFEPIKWAKFSKAIFAVEKEFTRQLDFVLNDEERNNADYASLVAQRLLFEEFMVKGFDQKEMYRALYGLVDSSPLFLYLFRFKLDLVSKDYQSDKLSGLYSSYKTERSSGKSPEEALNRAIVEYFTGGSFDL
jgi:hypothetical protein